MKKNTLLLILSITISIGLWAQTSDIITYEINFEFTGQIINPFDSVFTVVYVFDRSDLENTTILKLQQGGIYQEYSTDTASLLGNSKVKQVGNKLFLNVGLSDPEKSLPVVSFTGKDGKNIQAKLKSKKEKE